MTAPRARRRPPPKMLRSTSLDSSGAKVDRKVLMDGAEKSSRIGMSSCKLRDEHDRDSHDSPNDIYQLGQHGGGHQLRLFDVDKERRAVSQLVPPAFHFVERCPSRLLRVQSLDVSHVYRWHVLLRLEIRPRPRASQ